MKRLFFALDIEGHFSCLYIPVKSIKILIIILHAQFLLRIKSQFERQVDYFKNLILSIRMCSNRVLMIFTASQRVKIVTCCEVLYSLENEAKLAQHVTWYNIRRR
jgi:hypothetical protein